MHLFLMSIATIKLIVKPSMNICLVLKTRGPVRAVTDNAVCRQGVKLQRLIVRLRRSPQGHPFVQGVTQWAFTQRRTKQQHETSAEYRHTYRTY